MRNVCEDAARQVGRRRALALFGGALASTLAQADEAPVPASVPAPRPPATPVPTTPAAPASTLGKVDKEKSYFIFFQQNIDLPSMKRVRSKVMQSRCDFS